MSKSYYPERVPCICGCTVQEVVSYSVVGKETINISISCPKCGKKYQEEYPSDLYFSPNECNGEWNQMIKSLQTGEVK